MDQEPAFTRIADEMRTYGAIAIIGAGASKDIGFPLNAQLQTLLWHAIDTDPALIDRLAHLFKTQATTAKALAACRREGSSDQVSHSVSVCVLPSRE